MPAPYDQDIRDVDFRAQPERYRIGKGEQGVLTVEPYKSEILPFWRFKDPDVARESSEKIFALFRAYIAQGDFVGADMARKFLQMGMTRARRYANHRSGQKYDGPVPVEKRGQSGAWGRDILPADPDPVKAAAAEIFREKWKQAKADPEYLRLRTIHREKHENR